jgi:hypothetical protein
MPTEHGRISRPTRLSLDFAGCKFSALQALALIVLSKVRFGVQDGPSCAQHWRRLLASNLTLTEYRRKGWKTQVLARNWRDTLKALRQLGLLPVSGLMITDKGAAVAAAMRPLFNGPLSNSELVQLNQRIYAEVSR